MALLISDKDFSPIASKRSKRDNPIMLKEDLIPIESKPLSAYEKVLAEEMLVFGVTRDNFTDFLNNMSDPDRELIRNSMKYIFETIDASSKGPLLSTCINNSRNLCRDLHRVFHISLTLVEIFNILYDVTKPIRKLHKGYKLNFTLRLIAEAAGSKAKKKFKDVVDSPDLKKIHNSAFVTILSFIEVCPYKQQIIINLNCLLKSIKSSIGPGPTLDLFVMLVTGIPFGETIDLSTQLEAGAKLISKIPENWASALLSPGNQIKERLYNLLNAIDVVIEPSNHFACLMFVAALDNMKAIKNAIKGDSSDSDQLNHFIENTYRKILMVCSSISCFQASTVKSYLNGKIDKDQAMIDILIALSQFHGHSDSFESIVFLDPVSPPSASLGAMFTLSYPREFGIRGESSK